MQLTHFQGSSVRFLGALIVAIKQRLLVTVNELLTNRFGSENTLQYAWRKEHKSGCLIMRAPGWPGR
jgi:hypothetical protein